jgi:tRNA threonylcarbamoyladenosine biosynthesis protein TsaB
MMVLAIDTCGPSGSLALGRVEKNAVSILAQTELAGKTYSAELVPSLRALLLAQNMDMAALEAIVVVNGPGSFTGVRIGVSSAKGLAEALSIPVLAVSRLAVLAWKAGTESAALDAARGEFYFRDGAREILLAPRDVPAYTSCAIAICEQNVLDVFPLTILVDPPTAADALEFAAPRLLSGDFNDVATLDGNYVRRSDAEVFAKAAGKIE